MRDADSSFPDKYIVEHWGSSLVFLVFCNLGRSGNLELSLF